MSDVEQKTHAALGASSAYRWMACPGSVQLIEQVPDDLAPSNSIHAQEGTAAHALGELALRKGVDTSMWVGLTLEGIEVTEEMADHVRLYVTHCRDIWTFCPTGYVWVERRFNLAPLNPPGPMFGTADFAALDDSRGVLHVVDLKYGQGVLVEVVGSKQLRYYALGALLSLPLEMQQLVEKVRITIVQPRMAHRDGVIRSEEIDVLDLVEFAGELLEAARATLQPNAPLVAGSHCRWCAASAICPAQREHAMQVAQVDFEVVHDSDFVPPAPASIDPETYVDMLQRLPILEAWIANMYAHAEAKLERGEHVPGFKMVERRATRKWTSPDEAAQFLASLGVKDDEMFDEPALKSVAQIEKIVGKKKFASSPLAELVVKKSSGRSMVPDTDSRPALDLSAGEEFAGLLESGEESAGPREKE